ncbi:mechanosensitive ion channel family protein [Noviherbaspirillum aerium]|uniref:mechanosensitive ion channel family protein n=1 Tax=Noviherbaspirillum aerium TaxID=2588497 RepID=UPI001CEF8B45|nr:mechanosensitive ion channel domain-containing protein [Noviherbaspirillum aerium]
MTIEPDVMRQWVNVLRPWFNMILVWVLAWLALRLMRRVLNLLNTHILNHASLGDARRVETLMNVFRYTATIVIIGVSIMLTLGLIGISITPILATAGVAGIAVGFGAQSLVKDFFTGLFLLIENQVSEGDVIEAAGKSGLVERVTLRHIRIRDYDGAVHFIPNSMITVVTNRSRGFAYAVIDMNVKRQGDVERVFEMMHRVGAAMRADSALGPMILDDIDIAGVEKVEDAAISVRCRIKVQPAKQWRIRREFLRRMKAAIDSVEEVPSAA